MNSKKVYIIIRSIMGLAFSLMFTAAALYRIDIAKLEVYQLILTGTALEIAIFLFETPTGVLADMKSRRLSVIIGMFVIGLGISIEATFTQFWLIFLSQVVWGLGYTFISGALDSWVSDETGEVESIIITGTQFNRVFSFVGILSAALIGMYSIRGALYVGAAMFFILGVFLIFSMKEEHFHVTEREDSILKSYYTQLTKGFKHVRTDKVLKIMFFVMLFYGLYSEGIDRTYELHILDNLGFRGFLELPGIWVLAIVNAIVAIVGVVMLHYVKKYLSSGEHLVMYTVYFTIMMIVGVLLFGLLPNQYIALLGFLMFSITRESTYPLLDSILIKNTPSNIKATVLSTFGQLDAIGQLLSGAVMVGASLLFGLNGIYIMTALLLLGPVLLLPLIRKEV